MYLTFNAYLQASSAEPRPDIAPAEALLVSIYREIKDPDNIYAVVQSHSTVSLLPLLELEGKWADALSCYSMVEQGVDSLRGVAQALNQLDCRALTSKILRQAHEGEGNSLSLLCPPPKGTQYYVQGSHSHLPMTDCSQIAEVVACKLAYGSVAI